MKVRFWNPQSKSFRKSSERPRREALSQARPPVGSAKRICADGGAAGLNTLPPGAAVGDPVELKRAFQDQLRRELGARAGDIHSTLGTGASLARRRGNDRRRRTRRAVHPRRRRSRATDAGAACLPQLTAVKLATFADDVNLASGAKNRRRLGRLGGAASGAPGLTSRTSSWVRGSGEAHARSGSGKPCAARRSARRGRRRGRERRGPPGFRAARRPPSRSPAVTRSGRARARAGGRFPARPASGARARKPRLRAWNREPALSGAPTPRMTAPRLKPRRRRRTTSELGQRRRRGRALAQADHAGRAVRKNGCPRVCSPAGPGLEAAPRRGPRASRRVSRRARRLAARACVGGGGGAGLRRARADRLAMEALHAALCAYAAALPEGLGLSRNEHACARPFRDAIADAEALLARRGSGAARRAPTRGRRAISLFVGAGGGAREGQARGGRPAVLAMRACHRPRGARGARARRDERPPLGRSSSRPPRGGTAAVGGSVDGSVDGAVDAFPRSDSGAFRTKRKRNERTRWSAAVLLGAAGTLAALRVVELVGEGAYGRVMRCADAATDRASAR